jgi:deoxyribose-phosphate aldolase
MHLTASDIAKMIDLSCVRTYSSKQDIEDLVENARKYGIGQVSVMQSFIPYTKQLLAGATDIHVVGNVSFPSGSDSTSVKVFQAKEMLAAGCDEIDMVLNVGLLKSGEIETVERDVHAVIEAANPLPVKVIIEVMYLNQTEIEQACKICLQTGATFVKTGSGWAERGTTPEDVRLIRSFVGDKIKIKASGGIRDLATLVAMYKEGARRFGVNLKSGKQIVEECLAMGGGLEI